MKRRALGLAAVLLISANAAASEEQSDPLVSVVQHYVERVVAQQETSGKIVVDVVPALTNAGLCQMPCPFMPAGQRMRGNITVGVKCVNEQGHDMPRYYRARIGIEDDYIVAARDMMPGTLLSASDIDTQHGDITRLPQRGVLGADRRHPRRVPAVHCRWSGA